MLYKSLAAGVIAFGLPTMASAALIITGSMGKADGQPGSLNTIKYADGKLEIINTQVGVCGKISSWMEFIGNHIYCLDEVWTGGNGALYNLQVTKDGSNLTQVGNKLEMLPGPVNTARYGQNHRGLAVAAYGGGGLQTLDISNPAAPKTLQSTNFTMTPKPKAGDQQKSSHPHQVILDPTGDFIAVPDLGADLIRIFKVDKNTLEYKESSTVVTPDYSGPRHGAFVKLNSGTYFYVVTELSNEIIGWKVNYTDNNLELGEKQFLVPTHGPGTSAPNNVTAAAEIVISPDNKFLLISSRNEKSIEIPDPENNAAGQIPSDPIITYAIQADGTLRLQQIFPAGGVHPRHISLSKDGSLVVTALQNDNRIALIKRDVQTGNLTEFVGTVKVEGPPMFAKLKE
ncbi:Lactonase, 7-bladed beta-propeller-domain-containing protein [Sordaria brevicollis]|uniref:Lactonase, 7-bladed beta-propeller-domain-containing protein n=1 Tax=Sordaria brevicollis TaxID=83679 RepID=A0AAE0UDI6_SORBR|nr:Lactonase, 7-bladed beta-propeller-domain-containing protein [Sordaria brevicollis]